MTLERRPSGRLSAFRTVGELNAGRLSRKPVLNEGFDDADSPCQPVAEMPADSF